MGESLPYHFEIKSKNKSNLDWKELLSYKELFYFFTWRDVKVKYKQTFFGILWAAIQPLFMMSVLSFFLGSSLRIQETGMKYPVFLFAGLMLWILFSSGVTNAGNSMIVNAGMIKKIFFPRIIIPVSAIMVGVVDFIIAFAVFIVILFYYQQSVDLLDALWMWPLGIFLTIFSALGLGCWMAALNIKYRDFRYALPFLIQMMLFVTPVIYPTTMVSTPWIRYILALNPMHAALVFFRGPLSESGVDPMLLGISLLSTIILMLSGWAYFRKTEAYFADLA